ncbi:MAG TPA: hypothetical protein VG755_12670, partial [Nannocystaceae bacterium]|nr:hypothetical protein [Nannocystaceae bacterium]
SAPIDPVVDAKPVDEPAPAKPAPSPAVAGDVWATSEPLEPPTPAPSSTTPTSAPPPTVTRKVRAPRPIRWRFDPFVEIGTTTVIDPGYRAFDANRNLVHSGAGFRVDARLRGPVFLGTGVRYGYAGTHRAPYEGALRTKLAMHELQIIARLSIVLREGIDLIGQVDAGPSFRRLQLDSHERATRTRSLGGTFTARGGISLYLPKAWLAAKGAARATAGIDLLFGSTMRTPLRGRPRPSGADDDIATVGTPIGDVTVTGFTWTLGFFVRVM